MCGLAGIVGGSFSLDRFQCTLNQMGDVIAHRGPDDFGTWLDPGAWRWPGSPAPVHRRSFARRASAHDLGLGALRPRVQWRDLQPSRTKKRSPGRKPEMLNGAGIRIRRPCLPASMLGGSKRLCGGRWACSQLRFGTGKGARSCWPATASARSRYTTGIWLARWPLGPNSRRSCRCKASPRRSTAPRSPYSCATIASRRLTRFTKGVAKLASGHMARVHC